MQKQFRLTKKEDFNRVYRHGKSVANRQFVLYYMNGPATVHFRLGVSASKKLGNAVTRNRLRRVVKEIVRHHAPKIEKGYDMILIVRMPAVDMKYGELEKSVLHVLRRASLLNA